MGKSYTNLAIALGALLLHGCTVGRVLDADSGDPINGVTVKARSCPGCVQYTASTRSQRYETMSSDGIFVYDPQNQGPSLVPGGAGNDSNEFVLSKPGYLTATAYRRPEWKTRTRSDGSQVYYTFETISLGKGSDSDGDGLSDAHERKIQTNVNDKDTDDDGLLDGWEVYGHDWVPYPALGANPRKPDLFVEVDAMPGARLSFKVVDMLVDLYEPLFDLHLIQEDLPADHNCSELDHSHFNPNRQNTFKYVRLCLVSEDRDIIGLAPVGGRHFRVKSLRVNDNPDDDFDEENQFLWYAVFAHELGHTLGLQHGGDERVNCKPNYPSLMNYAFAFSYWGSDVSLRKTLIQLSAGTMRSINENSVSESNWGTSYGNVAYLAKFGNPYDSVPAEFLVSDRSVDWNRNGRIDGTVSANVNGLGHRLCREETPVFETMRDFNDYARVRAHLRDHLVDPSGLERRRALPTANECPFF